MHKKHMFLRVFSKITIFACVFCVFSAWAETTTCDINYTPVIGNSIQNGTPTPTIPVEIESIGTKVGNKYQISVTAQSKNLFSVPLEKCSWKQNVGEKSTKLTSNNRVGVADFISLKPNTTYYLSAMGTQTFIGGNWRVMLCDENDVVTNKISSSSIPQAVSFTTGANDVKFSFFIAEDKTSLEGWNFMLVEGSTAPASYEPYSAPITTTVYLDEPLRKVGDYADVLDYKKGQIIRNVGVKVLDGTESWYAFWEHGYISSLTDMLPGNTLDGMCNYFRNSSQDGVRFGSGDNELIFNQVVSTLNVPTVGDWKSWLASQYNAGTPVIVYYPLATPVVEQIENWSCIPPITDIQIATTKFVDDEFAAAEAQLATTVQTIESVVSRTIAQTEQIATLHETKQTRPDENCPANMKCLLVQDEDGTPHWYPIIEP